MATVKSICGRACEQSSKACVVCGIRSGIQEGEAHVIALLLHSRHTPWGHAEAVAEGIASSSTGILKAYPQSGLPVHAPLAKTREDNGQFLPEKEKLCSHVFDWILFFLFTISHHLYKLLIIIISS